MPARSPQSGPARPTKSLCAGENAQKTQPCLRLYWPHRSPRISQKDLRPPAFGVAPSRPPGPEQQLDNPTVPRLARRK